MTDRDIDRADQRRLQMQGEPNPSTDSPLSAVLDHVWNGNECGNCGEALTDDKYEYPERYPCAALAPQDWAGWRYAACGMVGHPAEAHWHPPYVETHPSAAHPGLHPTGWRLLPDWPWRERQPVPTPERQVACPLCPVGIAQQEPDLHLTNDCGCECHIGDTEGMTGEGRDVTEKEERHG